MQINAVISEHNLFLVNSLLNLLIREFIVPPPCLRITNLLAFPFPSWQLTNLFDCSVHWLVSPVSAADSVLGLVSKSLYSSDNPRSVWVLYNFFFFICSEFQMHYCNTNFLDWSDRFSNTVLWNAEISFTVAEMGLRLESLSLLEDAWRWVGEIFWSKQWIGSSWQRLIS